MYEDDVIRGVREARDAYARSHGYDIKKMVADLRAKELASGRPIVHLSPRRPALTTCPAGSEKENLGLSQEQRNALMVLAEVWALSPDVRLGQLLAHLDLLSESHLGKGLGYVEDHELQAVLNLHRDELKARLESVPK